MKRIWMAGLALLMSLYSLPSQARDGIKGYEKMQSVLDSLYKEMMPNCEELIGLARFIGGFAALLYISSRVWKHLASAEPIDFYPLFRPFVLGFCIIWFPFVLKVMDGMLEPTVEITADMIKNTTSPIKTMLALKEQALKKTENYEMYIGEDGKGDRDKYAKYAFGVEEGEELSLMQKLFKPDIAFYYKGAIYRAKNSIKLYLSEILMILYQAASLGINAIRTFQRVILAILGPLVFAIAIFDGFQHTLSAWIAKYINVFLWLPICNIFGAILGQLQIKMLKVDLEQMSGGAQGGDTYFSPADASYLIFLIIGIVGYLSVPTIAGFIVNAGGGGALAAKLGSAVGASTSSAAGMSGMAANSMSAGASRGANRLSSMAQGIGKKGSNGKDAEGSFGNGSGGGSNGSSGNKSAKAEKLNPSKK